MINEINFLGLGFEAGQEHSGLIFSQKVARKIFSLLKSFGLKIHDRGQINSIAEHQIIKSKSEFDSFNWQAYETATVEIEKLLLEKNLLLNWGGDHSVGIATAGAFIITYSTGFVVWIDAHADLNLPTESLTGNLHGMPVSLLLDLQNIKTQKFSWLKETLLPQNLIYVGVRDLDQFERTYQMALSFLILILSLGGPYASYDRSNYSQNSASLEQGSQI